MKKKAFSILFLIFVMLTGIFANAYVLMPSRPNVSTLNWYTHSSLGSSAKDPAINAAATWTDVTLCNISFSRQGDSSGSITLGDSRSDVCIADFSTLTSLGFSITANGATAVESTSNYSNFDIFLNTYNKTWGNGLGNYLDRQGILTHEFGHACGLSDNGDLWTSPDRISLTDYRTMWPHSETPLYENVTFYLRSLAYDDIQGVRYISDQIR